MTEESHWTEPFQDPDATHRVEGYLDHASRVTFTRGELPSPHDEPIVYAIGLKSGTIDRAIDASSILYVGQGRPDRLKDLAAGRHSALRALDRLRQGLPGMRLELEVRYRHAPCPELSEAAALTTLAWTHGETPPANARWEGYVAGAVLKALATWALEKGGGAARLEPAYDHPVDAPFVTWTDAYLRTGTRGRNYRWALGWVWPDVVGWAPESPADPALRGHLVLAGEGSGKAVSRRLGAGHDDWTYWKILASRPAPWLTGEEATRKGRPERLHSGIDRLARDMERIAKEQRTGGRKRDAVGLLRALLRAGAD